MAPFCDRYQVQKESSIWLCGISYCKQDKETANWIENGSALLAACDEDLKDFKNRLTTLHQELERFRVQRDAWDSLLEGFTEHAQSKDQEYTEMRQAQGEAKARRLIIIDGIKTARQKQEATKRRIFTMCEQARAVQEAKMRRVEQYVEGQVSQTPSFASPQAASRTENAFARGTLKRADSGLWETGDVSATPSRPTTNVNSPVKPTSRKVYPAKMGYSPPTLAPAFSFTTQKAPVDSNPSPPKKRRGRPPKVKPDGFAPASQTTPANSFQGSPINDTGRSITDYEAKKRRATKSAKAIVSPAQKLFSPGTRRSGRVKQRISYAESPTSSPERPVLEQPDAGLNSALVNMPERSTRTVRISSSKKKLHEEDMYAPDEEDDDNDARDHGDWQGDDDMGEDDMDIEDPPFQQMRSSTKRAANSPPRDPQLLKRQNTASYQDEIHGNFNQYGEGSLQGSNRQCGTPSLGKGWSYMEKPTNQPISGPKSNRSNRQRLAAAPNTSDHKTYMSDLSPQANLNRRYNTPPSYSDMRNGESTSRYQTDPLANKMMIDPMDTGSQQADHLDISPMRRSDMLNGLGGGGGGGDVLLPVDDLNDINYDFDVGAMSRQVAHLDAQQN